VRTLLISIGAVAGANARYWVGIWVASLTPSVFPWGTFAINVSGSALLGAFVAFEAARLGSWSAPRLIIAVGFCGAFTTFSTFSFDLFSLLQQRSFFYFSLYAVASVLIGLLALAGGYQIGSLMARIP
jgi:CrcB protein